MVPSALVEGPSLIVAPYGAPQITAGRRRELWVGTDRSCDVVVHGPGVMPRHLRLRFDGDLWSLEDASGGGTYLEGHAIDRLVILTTLDVRLGDPSQGALVGLDPRAPAPPPASLPVRTPAHQPPSATSLGWRHRGAAWAPYALVVLVAVVPVIVWALSR